jgi:hypothetical protein
MTPACIELLNISLQVDPENRGTIHKLKYIIDKSLIPQMKTGIKKANSDVIPSQNSSS